MIQQLKQDCETKLQQVLGEKDYWINAYYPTANTIHTDKYFISVTLPYPTSLFNLYRIPKE